MPKDIINMYTPSPIEDIATVLGLEMSDVLSLMATKRKEKILSDNHKHDIWQSVDGRWKTYLPKADAPRGRIQISSNDRAKLEDKLYQFYLEQENSINPEKLTLRTLYPEWIESKKNDVKPQTIRRIGNDWARYYVDNDIVDIPLLQLNTDLLNQWIRKMINDYEMGRHMFGDFSCIIRQMCAYAAEHRYIPADPFASIKIKWGKDLFIEEAKPDEALVFFKDEVPTMIKHCWNQYYAGRCTQQIFTPLAIIFCFYTGLRVSELAVLRFSDIHRSGVIVQRMLDDDGKVVARTKGGKPRTVPLTSEARKVIDEIKRKRLESGLPIDGYIFAIEAPIRVYNRIKVTIKIYCRDLGFLERSIHDVRRTWISKLIDDNVPIKTVMEYAGHKYASTTYKSYVFSIRRAEEMTAMLEASMTYA